MRKHQLLEETMTTKKANVNFDTPFKKHDIDERPTDLKEGENEHEAHEEAVPEEQRSGEFGRETRDYDNVLNEIEGEIKKMGKDLSDVHYESLRTTTDDISKKLQLEDRRNELRKRIIQAHEDFKETLKNKGEQEERKMKESKRTAAESRTREPEQTEEKPDRTEELLARSRVAEIETELAISRARRLVDLATLSDLDLVSFRLPYYYGYYSRYYPYTYRSYLDRYPYASLDYPYSRYLSYLDYPYPSSLYYPYTSLSYPYTSSLAYLDLTYPSTYLDYPYTYSSRYLDPYYYL